MAQLSMATHCWCPATSGATMRSRVIAAAVSPDVRPAAVDRAAVPHHPQQQQQQHSGLPLEALRAEHHQHEQHPEQHVIRPRGRLLLKQQQTPRLDRLQDVIPSSLHQLRGTSGRNKVSQQQQQQDVEQLAHHHQQQDQYRQQHETASRQSLRDKNLSFSGALRHTKTLESMLELLQNPQWGPGLSDLDGVSVVGALVWLVKSSDWQQLQQQGSVGQQQWVLKQDVQHQIQVLMDRAEDLVLTQNQNSSSSSSGAHPSISPSSAAAAAASGAAAPAHTPAQIRPAELANLIYVTSKLQQQRPQLMVAAAEGLLLDLYACSTIELNRLIWGLAHARVNPGDAWLFNFCKAAQAKLYASSPSQLAMLVYGVARLGYRPPDVWIAAWLEASLPVLGSLDEQNLATSAWGLSCFRFQAPPGWLSAFYSATSAVMPQLAPQGVSQVALSLVTLAGGQPPPDTWTEQLLAVAQPMLGQMELLQLCNLGWALANWQTHPDEQWMGQWVEASLPLLPTATPIDLSVLLWSCYKLSYIPQQRWLEAWFASTTASLPRCDPLQLSTVAFVLGEWGVVPAPGFSISFWRTTKARFGDFTAYQMSVLLWGLAKARRAVPGTWAAACMASFTQQLPEAEPGDVCRMIGALSRVTVKPRGLAHWFSRTPAVQQQLQQVVAWLLPQMAVVQPAWMMQLVPGLARLGALLDHAAVQGLNDAAACMDERLAPGQRKLLAGAFGKLRKLSRQEGDGLQRQLNGGGTQQQQQQQQQGAADWLPQPSSDDVAW